MLYRAIIASPISTAISRPYDSHLSQRRDGFKLSPWQGSRPYGPDYGGRAYQHTSIMRFFGSQGLYIQLKVFYHFLSFLYHSGIFQVSFIYHLFIIYLSFIY